MNAFKRLDFVSNSYLKSRFDRIFFVKKIEKKIYKKNVNTEKIIDQ